MTGMPRNEFRSQMAYRCGPHDPWPLPAERRRQRRANALRWTTIGIGLFVIAGTMLFHMMGG